MEDYYFLLLVVLYTIALSNSVKALFLRHSPSSTLAWILLNLGFPFIGVPLFFLLGQNRIRGYVKKKIKRDLESHLEIGPRQLPQANSSRKEIMPYMTSFTSIFTRFDQACEPSENKVTLLIDGEQTFAAIFEGIDSAKHYIFISYYILRSDRIGVELKELLIKKAGEGIKIFLLLDDMGSFWISRKFIKQLEDGGILISRFLPVFNLSRLLFINFRNHRKLVAVDGRLAFTGGLNVGDEYIGKKNSNAYWRDTHVAIEGPAVKNLETVFVSDWEFSTNGSKRSSPYKTTIGLTKKSIADSSKSSSLPCQIIPTGPTDSDYLGLFLFMHIIESAKTRLWISSPYLIPDIQIITQIQLACLRGVDVRILIPKQAANWFLNQISLYYARQLLLKGAKIYQYDQGFMHQKITIVDELITMTGSSNFDHRTIYLNFETSVLIYDGDFAKKATTMLEKDFGDSASDCPTIKAPHPLTRLMRSILRLTAPLL